MRTAGSRSPSRRGRIRRPRRSPSTGAARTSRRRSRLADPGRAGRRLPVASAQEAEQWRRALVRLWPDDADVADAGHPQGRRVRRRARSPSAHARLAGSRRRRRRGPDVVDRAPGPRRTRGVSACRVIRGDPGRPRRWAGSRGRALDILDADRHPADRARALLNREYLLDGGLDRLERGGDRVPPRQCRLRRGQRGVRVHRPCGAGGGGGPCATHETGRFGEALEHVGPRPASRPWNPTPGGDLYVALTHTHILLTAGRGADEIITAGRAGSGGGGGGASTTLPHGGAAGKPVGGVATRRAGAGGGTAHRPGHRGGADAAPAGRPTASVACSTCSADGGTKRRGGSTAVAEMFVIDLANRVLCAQDAPTADLWCARPQRAYHRLTVTLRDLGGVKDPGVDVAGLLVLAARAAADLAATPAGRRPAGHRPAPRARRPGGEHPPGPVLPAPNVNANRRALRATWDAEIGPPVRDAVARAVGGGRGRVGQARSAARLGVLPLAGRAGCPRYRAVDHGQEAAAPR